MSESDYTDGVNGPASKRAKANETDEQLVAAAVPSAPPPLSQQILQQVNAQNQAQATPTSSSKSREIRLEQNRKAARESRRRKKVMVEELQRSVIFFSRANQVLKQQHDEYSRMLAQAQATIAQMQQNGTPAPVSDTNEQAKVEVTPPVQQMPQPQAAPMQPMIQPTIQPQTVESTQQQPQNVATTAPISAEQAAQAQAVARAAAQQFAPQFAAMFGSVTPNAVNTGTAPNQPNTAAPSTPLQVAAANFQAAAAASLANGNLLGSYQTAFPGTGPYADAFQNALFQQQAAAAAVSGQPNFNIPPMNFGGPFQQAALAQHFGQPNNGGNFPNSNNGFVNDDANASQSAQNAPAPTAEPATAST